MRSTSRHRAQRLISALVLAVPTLVLAPGAPAQAVPHRAQLTYTCGAAATGHEKEAVNYAFVAALQLDLPAKVAPGDQVRLAGRFSVQLPEELRSLAAQYFTHAQAVSDSLTIPVVVGGRTTALRTSHFDSGKVTTKNQPLVLSGVVSAAPFTVPAGASGELRVELPANGSVRSNLGGRRVAFTAEALLSGGLVAAFVKQYVYKVACSAPAGARRAVASIPIVAGAQTGSTLTGATPSPGLPSSTASSATPKGQQQTAHGAALDAGAVNVAVPTRTREEPLPTWAYLAAITLVALAAVGVAGWSHHRVQMFRATQEG